MWSHSLIASARLSLPSLTPECHSPHSSIAPCLACSASFAPRMLRALLALPAASELRSPPHLLLEPASHACRSRLAARACRRVPLAPAARHLACRSLRSPPRLLLASLVLPSARSARRLSCYLLCTHSTLHRPSLHLSRMHVGCTPRLVRASPSRHTLPRVGRAPRGVRC